MTVDAAGKANPPEAQFIWSDSRTLFSVSVEVICLDEDRNELLRQRTECYYQNRNRKEFQRLFGGNVVTPKHRCHPSPYSI